ncbi:MAG: flagellar hook-basal body complex protein FliE [Calditrichia bacterium]
MVDKIGISNQLLPSVQPGKKAPDNGKGSFGMTLRDFLSDVNQLQNEAGEAQEALVEGELTDLHQVTLAAEKARVGLEMLLEMRNKVMESYQEIMRMQI